MKVKKLKKNPILWRQKKWREDNSGGEMLKKKKEKKLVR